MTRANQEERRGVLEVSFTVSPSFKPSLNSSRVCPNTVFALAMPWMKQCQRAPGPAEKLAEDPVLVQTHFCLPDYRVTPQPGECGRQEGSPLSKHITCCMWSFPLILQGSVSGQDSFRFSAFFWSDVVAILWRHCASGHADFYKRCSAEISHEGVVRPHDHWVENHQERREEWKGIW